ncbi:MAG: protein TolQ [Desulfobacteraceae bacterium]|nr:protein TolQ [Desulfobacteraceae bacterium]
MQDLSIVSMFLNAGLIVKCVMLLLMTFSIGSWYIIFMKFILFKRVRQDSESFLENFWRSKNLAEAAKSAQKTPTSPEAQIFIAGFSELQKISKSKSPSDANDTFEMRMAGMDNLKRALEKAATTESERLGRALSFLATTGSATPFIGLFGTVWGIMSSFQDIGQKGGASLAVVAPGISEALVATAAGLAVAIPSVIFFNYFTAKIADTENDMQRFSTDFLNLVERDLIAKL